MGWLFVIFLVAIPLWRLYHLRKDGLPSRRWARYRAWRKRN